MAYDFNAWVSGLQMQRKPWLRWYLAIGLIVAIGHPMLEMLDPDDAEQSVGNLAPLVFLVVGAATSPFARSRWSEPDLTHFDECKRIVLAHATRRADSLFVGIVFACMAWFWFASMNGWPMPSGPVDWSVWAYSLLSIGIALPILIAEIMVPLPPEGEEEDFA